MLSENGKSLLIWIIPLSCLSREVPLFFPHSRAPEPHWESCRFPGMSVSRGPAPQCQGTQTVPLCQSHISKPWEQFWREIKALSTQLSLEYFLYASHSLASANNIFPKCPGLRWYNSVIISMRELSGPVWLKEKQKGTAFRMQNDNNKSLKWITEKFFQVWKHNTWALSF